MTVALVLPLNLSPHSMAEFGQEGAFCAAIRRDIFARTLVRTEDPA
jgi:hypothetical protein